MNIYIPMEIKKRELEGRLLLALVAAERGHSVVLGSKSETFGAATAGKLPPGIIHEKSLTPNENKLKRLISLKELGHIITSQDEESGLLSDDYNRFGRQRFSKETLSITSKVLCWGEYDSDALRNMYPDFSDRFIATGSPRVDYWRKDFKSYYRNPKDITRDYILISSNFTNILGKKYIWEKKVFNNGSTIIKNNEALIAIKKYVYDAQMVEQFIKAVIALAENIKDHLIVVRPHPNEEVSAWSSILGEIPNVVVRNDGNMSSWIRNSKVLIHNGCTSAIEARFTGTDVIAYCPIGSWFSTVYPNKINAISENEMSLVTYVVKSINGELKTFSKYNSDLNRRFSNIKGPLAADLIVDSWETLDAPALNKKLPEFRKNVNTIKKIAKMILNKNEKNISNKFPYLHDDEIYSIFNSLRSTLNRFGNVDIRRIGEKAFLFISKTI